MATYPIKMLRDEDRQAFVPFTNAAAVVDKDNQSLQELMDNGKYKIQNNVTTSSAGKGVLDAYQGKVLNDKFNNYVPLSQKGVANGVASLDAEGKVPSAQLPSYVDDVVESYIVSGSTALSSGWLSKTNGGAALTPETGKIYLVMTSGSHQNKQYRWGGSTYVLCNPSDVNSVNGMTGVVTLKNLTIQKNGTQVGDTFNGTTDEVINITVPTNNNQLTNGAGYITSAGSITGNAATATALQTARNINTVAFDGSADIEIPYLSAPDNRDALKPKTLKQGFVSTGFGSLGGFDGSANDSNYVDYIGLNTWKNDTGGLVNALVFSKKGAVVYHYSGSYNADKWTTKKQLAYTDSNITGNAATATTASKTTGTLTIQKNGTAIDTFNGSANKTINVVVPTKVSELTNDSSFITASASITGNAATATTASKTTGTLTIQKNGTAIDTFNGSANKTINVTVPTKISELTNDSNYVKNTTYASATTAGVIKLGTGLAMADGVLSVTGAATADSVEWSVVKNKPTNVSYWTNDSGYITRSNTMTGATSSTAGTAGTVPAPAAGKEAQFLRGDGTWAQPSYATSAGSATSATKATQDGDGKTISSTYLKLSGGKLSGPISFASAQPITWVDGTYQQRLNIIDDSNTNTNVFEFQQSTDSGTSFATLASIKDNGEVVATKFTGALNGTATCSTTTFGTALIVERSGSTNMASIQFKNSNGTLGYIGMSATNGPLVRYDSAVSANYTFLDTGNYTTYTTVVHTGSAAPAASTGKNGDIYIVI